MDNILFQETCVYPRLNAALRNHDMRSLAPFLPYMKLLLSALYQLPLTHARTYRGVKLELFEVISRKHFVAWQGVQLLYATHHTLLPYKFAS